MNNVKEQWDIKHNKQTGKFIVEHENGENSYLDYAKKGDNILEFKYTFVPESQRKQGIAGKIVDHALQYARSNNYAVHPTCPFVKSYIERNSEYKKLVSQ